MPHLEHSHARSSERLENILRDAPQAFVDEINDVREMQGRERVEVRGRPNNEGSKSQLAHTHELLLKRKIDRLLAEAEALKQ